MQLASGSFPGNRQGLNSLGKRLDEAEAEYRDAFDAWEAERNSFNSLYGPWVAFDELEHCRAPLRQARSAYRTRARTIARNKYKPPQLPPGIGDDARVVVVRARDEHVYAQRTYDDLCRDDRATYRQVTDAAILAETAERIFWSLAEQYNKRLRQQNLRDITAQGRAFEWQVRRREREFDRARGIIRHLHRRERVRHV